MVFIRRSERKQRKQINVVIGVLTVKLRASIYSFFPLDKGFEEQLTMKENYFIKRFYSAMCGDFKIQAN